MPTPFALPTPRSFGLIMLEMLLGKFPYPHQENYFRLLSLIMDEQVSARTLQGHRVGIAWASRGHCVGIAWALRGHCVGIAYASGGSA